MSSAGETTIMLVRIAVDCGLSLRVPWFQNHQQSFSRLAHLPHLYPECEIRLGTERK